MEFPVPPGQNLAEICVRNVLIVAEKIAVLLAFILHHFSTHLSTLS